MEPQNETPAPHPGDVLPAVALIIYRIGKLDRNGACIAGDALRDCKTVAEVADLGVNLLTGWRYDLAPDDEDAGDAVDALDRINGSVNWPTFNAELIRVADLVFKPRF